MSAEQACLRSQPLPRRQVEMPGEFEPRRPATTDYGLYDLPVVDDGLDRELLEVLRRWQDEEVAVRIVTETHDLVAVFAGVLGARSAERQPALYWPIEAGNPALERRGIYAHPELLTDVRIHAGEFVVEYVQAGVTVNVRRLDGRGTA